MICPECHQPVWGPISSHKCGKVPSAAADLIRVALAGVAVTMLIAAVILIVRPVHSAPPVFVPRSFSPSPAAPCPAVTLSPVPLRGHPDCKGATP